ncbi:ATP-binding cassette domain-containing protein [Cupriavidus metallidurans]|uniref:ATP-binding cassette domain-containing protein n=1 Tax=Cupriavidus metallidurans TaxID=119219 RepID=UPI001BE079EE|nr:ATP-binding cassette domain-containing protein [Cupriavidus metallidurans]
MKASLNDPTIAPLLEVEGLAKRFGDTVALADVDFDLRPKEILGIIGPNGAGKTTLMECLVGLLPADAGEVRYRAKRIPPSERGSTLFYLPDGIAPWGDQPVWRVIGLFGDVYGFAPTQEARVVADLDLASVLSRRVAELSKGYRRRLLLAIALLTPQPILVLDEPFDGFDLRQTLHAMSLLREVAKDRALILSVHQLKDAERICDRLLLLATGQRLGFGTLADLTAQAGAPRADLEEVFLGLTQ